MRFELVRDEDTQLTAKELTFLLRLTRRKDRIMDAQYLPHHGLLAGLIAKGMINFDSSGSIGGSWLSISRQGEREVKRFREIFLPESK